MNNEINLNDTTRISKKVADRLSSRLTAQLPPSIAGIKENQVMTTGSTLFDILESKLTPRQLKIIKNIGHAISVGLGIEDAIIRAMITKDELDNLMLYVPEIKDYFRIEQVEYKYKLMSVVSKQAVENADVKIASWLLEKQFSEEFDTSLKKEMAKQNRDTEGDMIEMALAFVRRSSANSTPINPVVGEAKLHEQVKIYEIENIVKKDE